MAKARRSLSTVEIDAVVEFTASVTVDSMIQAGYMTADMIDRAAALTRAFNDFLIRDIRAFAHSGRYPEYPSYLEVVSAKPVGSEMRKRDEEVG